jgi:hypothetical protein
MENNVNTPTNAFRDSILERTGLSSFVYKDPFDPPDEDELPVLLFMMNDSDGEVRSYAAGYLASFHSRPSDRVIDALIKGLDDLDNRVKSACLTSLCVYGPSARRASAKVVLLLEDPDEWVQARRAWESIDPDEANKWPIRPPRSIILERMYPGGEEKPAHPKGGK